MFGVTEIECAVLHFQKADFQSLHVGRFVVVVVCLFCFSCFRIVGGRGSGDSM